MEIYEKDGHTVMHGDVLECLDMVEDGSVGLVFADPPYNIGKDFSGRADRWSSEEAYLEWCYEWLGRCVDKLRPDGSMYVMAATQSMPYIDIFLRGRMTVLSRIVWSYDSSGVQAKRYYGSMYEPVLFCVKDRKRYTFNADDILVEARTGARRGVGNSSLKV